MDYSEGVFLEYTVEGLTFACTSEGFLNLWEVFETMFWAIFVVPMNLIIHAVGKNRVSQIWSMIKDLMYGTSNWGYFMACFFYLL